MDNPQKVFCNNPSKIKKNELLSRVDFSNINVYYQCVIKYKMMLEEIAVASFNRNNLIYFFFRDE